MATIAEEIGAIVSTLPPDRQQDVLRYIRQLAQATPSLPPGAPMGNLLRFAGTIPPDVVDEMARAIEEGCETIEPDDDAVSF